VRGRNGKIDCPAQPVRHCSAAPSVRSRLMSAVPQSLRPLVVDLDGTLINTDLLAETAMCVLPKVAG
jgi:hypothetical protein